MNDIDDFPAGQYSLDVTSACFVGAAVETPLEEALLRDGGVIATILKQSLQTSLQALP